MRTRGLRLVAFALVAVASFGCAPTLVINRHAPPLVDPATTRRLGLEVGMDLKRQAQGAVMATVFVGQLSVPVDAEGNVRDAFARRLPEVGIGLCPQGPCADADATIHAFVVESKLAPTTGKNGALMARADLVVRVEIRRKDGRLAASRVLSSWRTGDILDPGRLMPAAADGIASELVRVFQPRHYSRELPLEDSGALKAGVERLLTNDPAGAEQAFRAVLQSEPTNAAAWYDLGVCGELSGEWTKAAEAYRSAVGLSKKGLYVDALGRAESEVRVLENQAAPAQ